MTSYKRTNVYYVQNPNIVVIFFHCITIYTYKVYTTIAYKYSYPDSPCMGDIANNNNNNKNKTKKKKIKLEFLPKFIMHRTFL